MKPQIISRPVLYSFFYFSFIVSLFAMMPLVLVSAQGISGGFLGDTRDLPNIGLPQIDKATGGFTYDFPLTIPPGRNSLSPDLVLQYNSQDRDPNALFGYGWSINIPYIQRFNKTGIDNLYTDNYFYSSLSGELVLVSGSTYAPKVENGNFLTYTYDGSYWTVKDKSGTVYKFGNAVASRQDNPSDSSEVYKWMLAETRDTNNNYIKYEYYKNAGQIYPDTITYTGNNTTDGIFTVVFNRESRADDITQSYGAFNATTSYRINEIQVKISGTWVRKYALVYTTGDNGQRSLLSSITESGRDESSNTTTLPAVEFTYQVSTSSGAEFVTDFDWSTPVSETINTKTAFGALIADVNGDGLPDIIESFKSAGQQVWYKGTYLNNGDGTWTEDTNLTPPIIFSDNSPVTEQGIRAADLNGDGLADIIQSANPGGGYLEGVYINQGDSWYLDEDWSPKCSFVSTIYGDEGCRLVDINGDGLPDFILTVGGSAEEPPTEIRVHLNNGNGWNYESDSSWELPLDLRWGVIPVDYNGDGLVDFLKGYKNPTSNPTIEIKQAYKNNGDKTWSLDSDYAPPVFFSVQTSGATIPVTTGVRLADINGDGLVDILRGTESTSGAHLNKGPGWNFTTNWGFGSGSIPLTGDSPLRMGDFDGDGMIDRYDSGQGSATLSKNQKVRGDLMITIKNIYGATTSVTYKGSPKYTSGGNLLNPDLPFVIMTVAETSTDPGFSGPTMTKTYSYEEGDYYYNTILDRRYAGFGKVIVTSAGNKTVDYYHQGNITNSLQGEYSDHASKIGKIYRTEIADSSGHIYEKTINKWDRYNQGTGRDYVKLVRSIVLTYDSDGDHRGKAEEYINENTYGNLTSKTMWGEVGASNDGSFSDFGTDKYTQSISYTSNTTDYIVGLPYQDTVLDQSSNKVRETRVYYDGQSLGSVTDGNPTKEERWKMGSTYVDTEKTYNATYGIVTSSKDERNKITNYSYDTYNLYPIAVTNPLSQVTSYTYDYSLGKPKQTTDPNGFVYQTVYDGLDRILQEKVPDLSSPYSPVVKTAYTYTDTFSAVSIHKTDYLDASNTINSYQYFDGLNRLIQERTEDEASGYYNVRDMVYNNVGLLLKESLPYSSSGTSRTSATTTASLYNNYTYDAMERVLTISNSVGTTTNAYDDWKTTVTDPNSDVKHYYNDAYENLVQVDEINGANTYSTYYQYNGNQNLTKITDALSNVRNFTYDGLSRRLTAEDLHAPADGTYGSWTYVYDDVGNLTQTIDPESQTVNYTYNDINQVLTEDYTGDTGTEVTYTYGGCTNGTALLCSVATAGDVDTDYVYNSNGAVASEVKGINAIDYTTSHTYDRQGNVLEITNPDNSKVKYTYNTAGQLEKIEQKENGGAYANVVSDFDYGPHGKVTTQENANGVITTNTYDSTKLYRLTHRLTQNTVPVKFQDLNYTYDNNGNITKIIDASETDSSKTVDYVYDDLNRLVSATATGVAEGQSTYTNTFTYNAIGNITNKSDVGDYLYEETSYANPHAVTSVDSVSQSYDNNGNLTSDGTWTHSWDYRNRLVESDDSTDTIVYSYDHQGQRASLDNGTKVTYYPSKYYNVDSNDKVTRNIFADGVLVATVRASAFTIYNTTPSCAPPESGDWTISTSCTFSGNAIAPASVIVNAGEVLTISSISNLLVDFKTYKLLVKATGGMLVKQGATLRQVQEPDTDTPTISYISTDHLSSTNIVTDSTGAQAELLDYFPYGNQRISTGSSQRQYIGEEYDVDTSLSYLNARYYNGEEGRFIGEDPVFLAIGTSKLTEIIDRVNTQQANKQESDEENNQQALQQFLANPQQLNSYSYAGNNPVTLSDPSGEFGVPGALIGGFIGGIFTGVGEIISDSRNAGRFTLQSDVATEFMHGFTGGAIAGFTGGAVPAFLGGALISDFAFEFGDTQSFKNAFHNSVGELSENVTYTVLRIPEIATGTIDMTVDLIQDDFADTNN